MEVCGGGGTCGHWTGRRAIWGADIGWRLRAENGRASKCGAFEDWVDGSVSEGLGMAMFARPLALGRDVDLGFEHKARGAARMQRAAGCAWVVIATDARSG